MNKKREREIPPLALPIQTPTEIKKMLLRSERLAADLLIQSMKRK
jgi:hypothetical protein